MGAQIFYMVGYKYINICILMQKIKIKILYEWAVGITLSPFYEIPCMQIALTISLSQQVRILGTLSSTIPLEIFQNYTSNIFNLLYIGRVYEFVICILKLVSIKQLNSPRASFFFFSKIFGQICRTLLVRHWRLEKWLRRTLSP